MKYARAVTGILALAAAMLAGPAPLRAADWVLKKGWPVEGLTRIFGTVLADLDRDGSQEVICTGERETELGVLYVFVFDRAGKPLRGWPQQTGLTQSHSPLVGDVNGDGELEIVASDGFAVSVWDRKGRLIGKRARPIPGMTDAMHSDAGAALGDIDGDGLPEMVYGTWGKQVAAVRLKADPEQVAGFPVAIGGLVGASPAVADLDGDGREEIVIVDESTGLFIVDFAAGVPRVTRGTDAAGAPLSFTARSSPAVGDLEGRGALTILVGSTGGQLHAFDARGVLRWSFATRGSLNTSPMLLDIDADGRREILFSDFNGDLVVLSSEGTLHAQWGQPDPPGSKPVPVDSAERPGFIFGSRHGLVLYDAGGRKMRTMDLFGETLYGDVDGDGRADLVVVGPGGPLCIDLPARAAGVLPWPMSRHDARRSGFAGWMPGAGAR